MNTTVFMGQFIIDKVSVMCVSRYITPETGYMTATRSKNYETFSKSKQTTYYNNIWSAYILRLTMSRGQFTKFRQTLITSSLICNGICHD